jgi:hypothetical protein
MPDLVVSAEFHGAGILSGPEAADVEVGRRDRGGAAV